uniref:EF-hand domain-containing protein n=1 Tax=Hanusia phi TaxID=3032 RepID=A0A7S0DZM1_9CRYP
MVKKIMRKRLCCLLVLCMLVAVDSSGNDEDDEGLEKVLKGTGQDILETFSTSKHPIKELQAKYGESAKMLLSGGLAGYLVGKIVKSLAISVIKMVILSSLSFLAAVFFGYAGLDTQEVIEKVNYNREKFQGMAKKFLDVNQDGEIDLMDAREVWKRIERVILRTNVPLSCGGVLGGLAALFI